MAQLQASTVAGILTTTGDVGIGTATPQSGGGASKWVTLEGGASYSGGIIYSQQGAVKAYHYTQDNLLHHQGASGVGHIWLTSNNEKMRLTDGGNVGIGTTAPGYKLHVAGNSYFGDTIYNGGGYISWTTGYSDGTTQTYNGNSLAFLTNSSSYTVRMFITSNGNVGIGTNNPTNRLTVYQGGGVRVNGIVSGDWIEMSGDLPGYSANQYPVIKSNGTIHFANNNKYSAYLEGANTYFGILDSTTTTRVFLATSGNTYFTGGNVGIGTVTPRKELDVQGNNLCVVAGQLILGEDAYLTSANYIGLKTSFQSGTNDYMILSGKSDGATYVSAKAGSSVFIRSGGNTSAAQIEVTDTYARTYSNLGVGTVPSQALDVAGNIRSSNVIYWNGITGALSWDTGVVTMETNTATAISLKTNGANRLYITSGGNVGIGTTNPVGKLDVRAGSGGKIILGSYDANYNVTFEGGDQLNFYYGASATTGYINYNGPGNILLSRNLYVEGNSSGGTTGAVRINSAGNVGIGLTNPGAKLQVAGTVATDSALADVDAYRIIKPNGGVRVTANSSETGAIKITYPVGWTNTMHRVKLNVYEYTTNESFTIYFGGYNYAPGGGYWYNVFAYTLNNPGVDRNFTVRFGYDGTSLVVYIGELASGWTYPQIFIEEVELGYSGQSSTWRDGAWAIGFEASAFQNITRTISNPQATNWARNGSSVYFENGNVGIGTVTPTHKLHVNGNLRVDSSTSFTTEYGAVPNAIIGNTQDEKCLGTPDEWLAINVSGTDYAVPLFSLG